MCFRSSVFTIEWNINLRISVSLFYRTMIIKLTRIQTSNLSAALKTSWLSDSSSEFLKFKCSVDAQSKRRKWSFRSSLIISEMKFRDDDKYWGGNIKVRKMPKGTKTPHFWWDVFCCVLKAVSYSRAYKWCISIWVKKNWRSACYRQLTSPRLSRMADSMMLRINLFQSTYSNRVAIVAKLVFHVINDLFRVSQTHRPIFRHVQQRFSAFDIARISQIRHEGSQKSVSKYSRRLAMKLAQPLAKQQFFSDFSFQYHVCWSTLCRRMSKSLQRLMTDELYVGRTNQPQVLLEFFVQIS